MRIAIDIDKTIFNCNSFLYKIINTYLINQDLNKELKYKVVDLNVSTYYINNFMKKLSKMHNPDFYSVEENASKIMKKWMEEGNEIILLSSRPAAKSLVSTLLFCLKKYDVPFTQIVVSCNNKAIYCKKDNIDLLIDDSHFICLNAKKIGVESIWYIAKYKDNKDNIPNVDGLKIASSWEELDKFIKEKIKNKNR